MNCPRCGYGMIKDHTEKKVAYVPPGKKRKITVTFVVGQHSCPSCGYVKDDPHSLGNFRNTIKQLGGEEVNG